MFISEFLSTWLAGNVLNQGLRHSATLLLEKVEDLKANPSKFGWQKPLDEVDRRVLDSLIKTNSAAWRQHVASMKRAERRAVLVCGPSGVGKSQIARVLNGKDPLLSIKSSHKAETTRIYADMDGLVVKTAPGSLNQARDGSLLSLASSIAGRNPPKIFCFVTAAGYHATASDALRGTFFIPSRPGEDLAKNVDEFRNKCLEEEIRLLNTVLVEYRSKKIRKKIPTIITIVNKRDLWQANDVASHLLKARYAATSSNYGLVIGEYLRDFGLGRPREVRHIVFPMFTIAGGFHPDTNVTTRALTIADAIADAMVLRALIYYFYSDGGGQL